MKVALIQSTLVWENPTANRKNLEGKIRSISEKVDLVVLPEMFTTGFSMQPEKLAETMQGETVQWMQSLAKTNYFAICGSVIILEKERYFNRLLFVFPSGEIQFYNKRHLFSLAGEDDIYTKGSDKLIVEYQGFRICPLVCYDLRFPVFSRNVENYDLLIYVANWPKPRINAWNILVKARAVENMSYAIGVNIVGKDGNGHDYSGHSQLIDFLGNEIVKPTENEGIFIAEINKEELLATRQKLGFLNDRDAFTI